MYEWAARLSKGRINLSDEQHPGRPREARTNQMFILADRRITIDDIAAEVGISHGTAHNIYTCPEMHYKILSCMNG